MWKERKTQYINKWLYYCGGLRDYIGRVVRTTNSHFNHSNINLYPIFSTFQNILWTSSYIYMRFLYIYYMIRCTFSFRKTWKAITVRNLKQDGILPSYWSYQIWSTRIFISYEILDFTLTLVPSSKLQHSQKQDTNCDLVRGLPFRRILSLTSSRWGDLPDTTTIT